MKRSRSKSSSSSSSEPSDTRKPTGQRTLQDLVFTTKKLRAFNPEKLADLILDASDGYRPTEWPWIVNEVGWEKFAAALAVIRAQLPNKGDLDKLVQEYADDYVDADYQTYLDALGPDQQKTVESPPAITKDDDRSDDESDEDQSDADQSDEDESGGGAFTKRAAAAQFQQPSSTGSKPTLTVSKPTLTVPKVTPATQQLPPAVQKPPPVLKSAQPVLKPVSVVPKTPAVVPKTPAAGTGQTKREVLAKQLMVKFTDIINDPESKASPAKKAYAESLRTAVIAAGDETTKMARFDPKVRATMADIMAGWLPDGMQGDQEIDDLVRTAREYLATLRNTPRFEMTGKPLKEVRDWLKAVRDTLVADGFNDLGEMNYLTQNINKVLAALSANNRDGDSWAKLTGYVFQLNRTAKAHREYRLMNVEVSISAQQASTVKERRSVDTREVIFTPKGRQIQRLREYKAYADKDTVNDSFDADFAAQLQDYVKIVREDKSLPDLHYVFSGPVPAWALHHLAEASEALKKSGRKLYMTEGTSTSVVTADTVISLLNAAADKQQNQKQAAGTDPGDDQRKVTDFQRKDTAPANLNKFSNAKKKPKNKSLKDQKVPAANKTLHDFGFVKLQPPVTKTTTTSK